MNVVQCAVKARRARAAIQESRCAHRAARRGWIIAAGLCLVPLSCAPGPGSSPSAKTSPAAATETVKEADTPVATTEPPAPPIPGSLKTRIEAALRNVRERELTTTHPFWAVFHGILGIGPGLSLRVPGTGNHVNALDYVFGGDFQLGEIPGLRFEPTKDGLDVRIGPMHEGQGHQDQFVAEITQWGVPIDRKVFVFGKQYTLRDFVNETKAHARLGPSEEHSWSIVVISQFDGTKAAWVNKWGDPIRLEDLVRHELNANITEAACGGTHRLFGLTWALHVHLRNGGKKVGLWKEVADKLEQHQQMARQWQNPDGSFSSNYFSGPGHTEDIQKQLGTSGHILEWLADSLPEKELRAQWMQDAANRVALDFLEVQAAPMESGALYHAAHGLVIYYRRVFGWDPHPINNVAGRKDGLARQAHQAN